MMMVVMYQATPKQHLKLNSKVKQRWGWAEKSVAYKKAWNYVDLLTNWFLFIKLVKSL